MRCQQPQHTPSGTDYRPVVPSQVYVRNAEGRGHVGGGVEAGRQCVQPGHAVTGLLGSVQLLAGKTVEEIRGAHLPRSAQRGREVVRTRATVAATISAGVSVSNDTW